jgi:beta-xylosidase
MSYQRYLSFKMDNKPNCINMARKLDEIVHFMEQRNAREQAQMDKMEKKTIFTSTFTKYYQ